MSVSNTPECFDTFAGRKLLGTVRNLAAPAHPQDTGYSLLIFDDGRGLAISVLSSYWVVSQDEVLMLLASKVEKLRKTVVELQGVHELQTILQHQKPQK